MLMLVLDCLSILALHVYLNCIEGIQTILLEHILEVVLKERLFFKSFYDFSVCHRDLWVHVSSVEVLKLKLNTVCLYGVLFWFREHFWISHYRLFNDLRLLETRCQAWAHFGCESRFSIHVPLPLTRRIWRLGLFWVLRLVFFADWLVRKPRSLLNDEILHVKSYASILYLRRCH